MIAADNIVTIVREKSRERFFVRNLEAETLLVNLSCRAATFAIC
jgi:hypothetical protein